MNPSKSLLALTLLSSLWLACEKQSTAEPTAASSEPAPAAEPAAEEPAADEPAAEANKCVADGGTCTNKTATVACARFEEGAEWGCAGPNEGCCFQ